tara:strand:- start:4707 stop:5087 length:381 start_codon:yes stop_codon:yes gene_type:complete
MRSSSLSSFGSATYATAAHDIAAKDPFKISSFDDDDFAVLPFPNGVEEALCDDDDETVVNDVILFNGKLLLLLRESILIVFFNAVRRKDNNNNNNAIIFFLSSVLLLPNDVCVYMCARACVYMRAR